MSATMSSKASSTTRWERLAAAADVARDDVTRQTGQICVPPLMSTLGLLAEQFGRSARVIHSVCCPAGERPTSPDERAISWRNDPSGGVHRARVTASYQGMCQDGRARQADQSRGQTSPEPPRPPRRPRQLRTGGHHPRPPADRRPDAHRGYSNCGTRAGQVLKLGLPRRRRRTAASMRATPRTGRHDRSDLHRHLETRLHPRLTKAPSGLAANAMYRQMSSRL